MAGALGVLGVAAAIVAAGGGVMRVGKMAGSVLGAVALVVATVGIALTGAMAPAGAAVSSTPSSPWSVAASYRDGVAGLNAISCPTTAVCEAVGATYSLSTAAGAIRTTDGGTTWTQQALPTDVTAVSDLATAGSTFVAVGMGSGTTGGVVLTDPLPAPTTTVGLPAAGSTLTGGVWLDASAASPDGVAGVHYVLSGGSLAAPETSATATPTSVGWLAGWASYDVPNGTYTVESVVDDLDGAVGTSAPVSVTVSNHSLGATVLRPATGAVVSGPSVVLDASATGRSTVTGVTFSLSGGSLAAPETIATATLTVDGWIALWDATSTAPGSYTLTATATDANGHTATSAGITVTVGSAPVAT